MRSHGEREGFGIGLLETEVTVENVDEAALLRRSSAGSWRLREGNWQRHLRRLAILERGDARHARAGVSASRLPDFYRDRTLLQVTAEDVAEAALFLAIRRSAKTPGTVLLPVDGGNLALNAGGSHTWITG